MGFLQRINSKFIVISLSVLLLLYFVVFPLGVLLYDSILVDGSFTLANYREVYSQDVNWRALANTVELSLIVMVASVIITFPLAWLVGRTDLPFKRGYRTLLVASYMIPPYVGAIAWVQLLNPSVGYLNNVFKWIFNLQTAPFDIYTTGGLAWVLTLFYSPFAFITISRAMEKMDPTLEEAARVSGSSPLRTLIDVTLPLMAPSILAGGLLVFIAAGSCFGIPAIVGMPGNIEVMTTRIVTYTYMGDEAGIRDATSLAASLMFIANALLYLKISVPIIPPMAVLVILRNMLQGIQHTIEPLLASALELIGKVIFAVWLVPVWGYRAVCFCEPTTWVICFVFILFAAWRCRGDLRDA